MDNVFKLKSEVSVKEQLISQFSNWWSDDEIVKKVIPNIVDQHIVDSIIKILENYSKNENFKPIAEILYDLVGQNFLVNSDKSIRLKFLNLILKRKVGDDPTFQSRFNEKLIQRKYANKIGICKKCNEKWLEKEEIYVQSLGLKEKIICKNQECVFEQQKNIVPEILDGSFFKFISNTKLNSNYLKFCKKLIIEFNFPLEVLFRPSPGSRLLPETIKPLGNFLPLYDYQASIGSKIIKMLEEYEIATSRALVVLPTGAGKTRLVVEALINWINDGKKGKSKSGFVIWIVDKNELCQQAFDTFAEIFRQRGKKDSTLKLYPIYGKNKKNIRDILYQHSDDIGEINEENGVIIASIQSLYSLSNNDDKGSLPELGRHTSIVIIDEAHHAIPSNKSYTNVLRALGFDFRNVTKKDVDIHKNKVCLLGLTATPFRGVEHMGRSTKELLNRFGGKDRIIWPPFSNSITNESIKPHADLNVQNTAFQNELVKLYGDGSYSNDSEIIEYRFIVKKSGNNSEFDPDLIIFDEIINAKNIEVPFKDHGKYIIQLTVKDDNGKESENFASKGIEIFPIEKSIDETNVEKMKKLYQHLIKREILSTPHHYIIDFSKKIIDVSDRDKQLFERFHDISNATIREIGKDSLRNYLIIKKIRSLIEKENRKSILLFACSVNHSKLISFILDAMHGIKSASIDHTMSIEDRNEIIHDFRIGKISVLCNYDILSTGFDSPKVDCVFVARPTFSHLLYNQMTGRGLRGPRNNGTQDCVIIDISDSIQLVEEEEENKMIDQSWKIFKYIYKTTFDEYENIKNDQTCYGCFGLSQKIINDGIKKCMICNGVGIIPAKKTPGISDQSKKKLGDEYIKLLQQERFKHPDWDFDRIKREVKRNITYKRLLDRDHTQN